ncbi:hypothetical protein ACRZEW_004212 [Enterobacter ludwigii]
MKMSKPLALLLMLGMFSTTALANEAHVCRSAALPQSHKESGLSDTTSFTCGGGLTGTVPTLAQEGWQITNVLEQADTSALSAIKPGQIPSNPEDLAKTYWVLLIQK